MKLDELVELIARAEDEGRMAALLEKVRLALSPPAQEKAPR